MMMPEFSRGDVVLATGYGGKVYTLRVIADAGKVINVCNEEEFILRDRPRGIGWPREDVAQKGNLK